MSKKIAIFGCGQQGSCVAAILTKQGHIVTCLDMSENNVPDGCEFEYCEFVQGDEDQWRIYSDFDWDAGWDLVVNALPSEIGTEVLSRALDAEIPGIVDVAFSMQNKSTFHASAKSQGSVVIHDCGLAPGLPNLLIGHELVEAGGTLPYVNAYVGGVSQDPKMPYGYKVSWSLEDLYEEYVRVARFVEDHKIRTLHPIYSSPSTIIIEGVEFEAFVSDGLRSLLDYKDRIQHMREYTLRYPGHLSAIHELLDAGDRDHFIKTIGEECQEGGDVVYLKVDFPGVQYTLKVESDKEQSAMTKTTAYACAAFCSLLLDDSEKIDPGVWSCERLGEAGLTSYILEWLRNNAGFSFDVFRYSK